jgi:hypothetical protein
MRADREETSRKCADVSTPIFIKPPSEESAGEGNRTLVARVASLDDCFWLFHAVFGCYWFFGSRQFPTVLVLVYAQLDGHETHNIFNRNAGVE